LSPVVGVILGSKSDLPLMEACVKVLEELGIEHELKICSAHRNPRGVMEWASSARERGLKVLIAAAGGAAHLPGVVAAWSDLPVIGVPVPTQHLGGLDSLYSIVQMPAGIPVATVAIGEGLAMPRWSGATPKNAPPWLCDGEEESSRKARRHHVP
jgi:5-(carboxyamino)imidazole ribonucleotide mutase